jgi:heme/copper-type cytochrome/quinol oxidase subunit 2
MKRSVFHTVPNVVLWFCTLITLGLSVWFYCVHINQPEDADSPEVSALLYWIFFLFTITVFTGLIFSIVYYVRRWKENPKKVLRTVLYAVACGLLLLITWVSGSGNPLPLAGYKGNDNTYFWLKITDMWLYSIYVLLGVCLLALIGGIIWSYFKKAD